MDGQRSGDKVARYAAAVLALALASPALASPPSSFCATASADTAPHAAGADLVTAADHAEDLLTRRSGTDDDAHAIDVALDVAPRGDVPPDAAALARYCAAAGEWMRVAASGSQQRAQRFLLSALTYARTAGKDDIGARAAYRLGLASVSANASGATRGARGAESSTSADTVVPPTAPAGDACATLGGPGLLDRPGYVVTQAALRCAAEHADQAGDQPIAALARLRLARLALVRADRLPFAAGALREQAANDAKAGLAAALRVADPALRATLAGRLAGTALDAGVRDAPTLLAATAAMRAATPDDRGTLAVASALEGRLALVHGDRASAARALQTAVFLEAQRPQPLRLSEWLLLLAKAEPARGKQLVLEAYQALQSVRPLLPIVDPVTEELNFALRMRPVFEAAVAVQLSGDQLNGDQAQIASAQQIVEAFREAELQSAFGSNCVPPLDPVRPTDLRPGEMLLYPILLDDHVELIFASGSAAGGPEYRRLPASAPIKREDVARLVDDMVGSTSLGEDEEWRAPARRLYDLLIKPIEGTLTPGSTLVIVPDGPLRALPFAALLDGKGKFLIERTRLDVAPALSYSQPGSDRGNKPLSVVAAALDREVVLPAGTFPKLAGTEEEARVAAGPGGAVISNFREADLRRALGAGDVDVLHLATHAAFNGRSDRSFIVANDEAIPISDLRGLIGRDRARGDELDLLVLSACETAVGDDQASMGLAGAAVQAGAQSAIASLWEVNDTGTVALMKAFYDHYRAGESKAEALRNAQLALVKQGGDLANPNIWAAFSLIGGWR